MVSRGGRGGGPFLKKTGERGQERTSPGPAKRGTRHEWTELSKEGVRQKKRGPFSLRAKGKR